MSVISEKVERISSRMAGFCTVLIYIIPVILIWSWINYEAALELGLFHRVAFPASVPSFGSLIGGFMVSGLLAAIVVGALYHLKQFFKQCSRGNIFTIDGAEPLLKFTKYIVLYAFLAIPVETILGAIMTINNPVGERVLMMTFQTYDLTVIFLSLVLLAISWIHRESVDIAAENAQII